MDVAEKLEALYFHGVDKAIAKQRLNKKMIEIFDRMVLDRAVQKEARRLKLDETDEFRNKLDARRSGLVFGVFMTKVVEPDVQLNDAILKQYMEAHPDEYSYPEMIRVESLAFVERTDAEKALDRLHRGADIKWMRENAEGQVELDPATAELPVLSGQVLMTSQLPDSVQVALSGAARGDARFLAVADDGPYLVLFVRDRVASKPMAFDDVKERLVGEVYRQKRLEAFEGWITRLREASEIEIFATGDNLDRVLFGDPSSDS
jgi:hypothetical protein